MITLFHHGYTIADAEALLKMVENGINSFQIGCPRQCPTCECETACADAEKFRNYLQACIRDDKFTHNS